MSEQPSAKFHPSMAIVAGNGAYSQVFERRDPTSSIADCVMDVALLPDIQIALGNAKMQQKAERGDVGPGIAPPSRILSVLRRFVSDFQAGGSLDRAMEDALRGGSGDDAALMRLMGSWLAGIRGGALTNPRNDVGECKRIGALLAATGRWRLCGPSAEAPCLELRVAGFEAELSAPSQALWRSFEAAAKAVANEANEGVWPASPFAVRGRGAKPVLWTDLPLAETAIACSAMSGSAWVRQWMAKGAPSLRYLADGCGASSDAMLARLWMDVENPFDSLDGGVGEKARWRAQRSGGLLAKHAILGGIRQEGRGIGRSHGFLLGLNLGSHLVMSAGARERGFGESLLLNLAEQGAHASVADALGSLVATARKMSDEQAEAIVLLMARVENVALDDVSPICSSSPALRTRRL